MRAPFDDWLLALPPAWHRDVAPEAVAAARDAYESPGRHYHAWPHVEACVALLRSFDVARPRPVFLALVFHDAVYEAGRADNEARSAALARETLARHARLPDDELASVDRMILATRDHHALGAALPADERAMLDLDLAILAADWPVYARYAEGVEREYVAAATSAALFRVGRIAFLERTLAQARIYLTDAGERRWGAGARANVARELEERRGG